MLRRQLKGVAKLTCPPLFWNGLRHVWNWPRRARLRQASISPPAAACISDDYVVRNLAEIDRAVARANAAGAISDDALRQCFDFRFDPGKLNLPADPDCLEYRQAQMALYTRISGRAQYEPTVDEQTPLAPSHVVTPFPYATKSFATVGDQLIAVGFLIRAMGLRAGGSILEFGPGWGLSTLELIQMGYDVTAVDVNPGFISLVAERARRLEQQVHLACSDMLQFEPERRFDRVLFYECFHHASDHLKLLEKMDSMVAPDGAIIFAGEPIADDFYCPWGVRLDGQSVWSIRRFGWLELGFRTDYFRKTLERLGWSMAIHQSHDVPWMRVYVARRK